MLNPCCGGHAYVGHTGGEIWEAWISFAGPIWDISLAFLYYFILKGVTQDGYATSVFLPGALSFMNVREGHFMNRFFQNTEITFTNAGVPTVMRYNAFSQTPNMTLTADGWQVGRKTPQPTIDRGEHTATMTKHPYDDSNFMWEFILAMLMDWAFISFCFNMLPIITLDVADFFGSWVRLCSTPVVSAVFIIVTSFICIIGLLICSSCAR